MVPEQREKEQVREEAGGSVALEQAGFLGCPAGQGWGEGGWEKP